MRPKVILNLLFFLFCCTAVQAQTGRQITGKVIDAMGELPGVSVVIKGTTNGTTTDLNGEFKLDNVKNGDVLQFSFIGYKTENVKVGNQSKFDITMTENTQTLEEVTVVAVGYGDVRRRDRFYRFRQYGRFDQDSCQQYYRKPRRTYCRRTGFIR